MPDIKRDVPRLSIQGLRWMIFVDGENLSIRAKSLGERMSISLPEGAYYAKDIFIWLPGYQGTEFLIKGNWGSLGLQARRAYYYTAVQGDEPTLETIRESLWALGFEPNVFKKPPGRRSKGLDITLTKDVLSHAYKDNYDVAMLITGDADYVPVVEEVKRTGKLVCVNFFAEEGLSPELRLAADFVLDLTVEFVNRWTSPSEQKT